MARSHPDEDGEFHVKSEAAARQWAIAEAVRRVKARARAENGWGFVWTGDGLSTHRPERAYRIGPDKWMPCDGEYDSPRTVTAIRREFRDLIKAVKVVEPPVHSRTPLALRLALLLGIYVGLWWYFFH